MLSRNTRVGSVAVMALALFSGGFSRPNIRPISARNLLQPAQWHSQLHCYKWGGGIKNQSPGSAHLNYYGGPVLSNVKLVMVLYGSGTYQSFITATGSASMAGFYSAITGSSYITWLSEYNTPTQSIGTGTYAGTYKITPRAKRDGSTISDTAIQAELNAQINAGHLPVPDSNTVYMVHFPKGKRIRQGTSYSCQAGGFCAYHGTFLRNSQYVYYGVLPDMSSGSGCDLGCGGGSPFGNQTSVASHEMTEAITDAAVGQATTFAVPLAWYDPNNGEIGDICNGQQATITIGGTIYTVQKEWSNSRGVCYSP